MKPTDFIKEEHNLVQAATEMHTDHEIQMAREACYRSASNAIELHRMLKHISEQEGLQAWASEKISLANDYLRAVKEWLEYELMSRLEGRVAENNMDIVEGTKETSTGRVHKSEPGGYGRRDDEDEDKKKAKPAEPAVKRGRGRPKKDADSDTGEVKKWDTAALSGVFGGSVPKKLPGKASVKHKIKDEPDEKLDENDSQAQLRRDFDDVIQKVKREWEAKRARERQGMSPRNVSEPSRAELEARLRELESKFDPEYQYSDDYSFWTKQNAIAREIASIKKKLGSQGVAEGLDPDTQRLEQEVRDALANGDDYTAKSLVKMAQTAADRNYLRKIIRQEMYGTGPGQGGVAEGSDDYNARFRAREARQAVLDAAKSSKEKEYRQYGITARKHGGDDAYSWAVFINGRVMVNGLSSREVPYYKKIALEKAKEKQGVAEGTAGGINNMFNNMYDPMHANLQRVALLAMQGRQSEASPQLNRALQGVKEPARQQVINAVNNIKPVTINGKIADSSALDKSSQHNDWILKTFIPWVEKTIGKGVAEAENKTISRVAKSIKESRVAINQDPPDNLYDIQNNLEMSRWKSSVKNVITSLFAKRYPGVQLFFKNTQEGNLFVTTDKSALDSENVGLYSDTDEFSASIIGPTAEYGVDDILYVGIGFDSIKSGKYKGIVGEMLNTIVPPLAAKFKAKPAIVIVVEDQSAGAWEAMAAKLGWAFISGEDEQGVAEGSDPNTQSHLDTFKSETDTMKPGTTKYVGRKDGKEVYAKKDAKGNVKFYHRDGIKGPLKGVAEGLSKQFEIIYREQNGDRKRKIVSGTSKEAAARQFKKQYKLEIEQVKELQQGVAEGENIGGERYDKIADLKGRTVNELNKLIQKLEGIVANYPDHPRTNEYLGLAKMIRAQKIGKKGVAEGLDPDTQRLEQEVRDALANGDDYTAKSLVKMAQTAADRNYLRKIIRQEMYGTGPGQGGVAEGTKETSTGRIHKSEPGGYGRRDDDDIKKKEKAAEPVKRGRGRPKKDADSETGEVKKWDTDTLQRWIVGSVPKKLPGKASVKHKIKDEPDDKMDESMRRKQTKEMASAGASSSGGFAVAPAAKKKIIKR